MTTREAAAREKTIHPIPRPLRVVLAIFKPVRNKATVMPASTSDMAIMANQYSTSNRFASNEEFPVFKAFDFPFLC